jgi:hypothetical protein
MSSRCVEPFNKFVHFVNSTGEDVQVKGPYPKGFGFAGSKDIERGDVRSVPFDASDNTIMYTRFLVGPQNDRKAIEFNSKFPGQDHAVVLKKEIVKDKSGKEVPSYKVFMTDRFSTVKTADANSF